MSARVHFTIAVLFAVLSIVLGQIPYYGNYRGSFFRRTVYDTDDAVWYPAESAEDCQNTPEKVNSGTPDICANAAPEEKKCVCMKPDGYSVYIPLCGVCTDPCKLKFVPDRRLPYKSAKLEENKEDAVQY